MSTHVNIFRENAVFTLTTARPEKTKALTNEMYASLGTTRLRNFQLAH